MGLCALGICLEGAIEQDNYPSCVGIPGAIVKFPCSATLFMHYMESSLISMSPPEQEMVMLIDGDHPVLNDDYLNQTTSLHPRVVALLT